MDTLNKRLLQHTMRRIPLQMLRTTLEKWGRLTAQQQQSMDFTQTKLTLTEHLLDIFEVCGVFNSTMSTKSTLLSGYFSVLSAKSTALGVNTFRQVKCCSTTLHWCKHTGIWRINRGVFTVAILVLLIELKLVSLFYRKMAGQLNISQNSRWHVSQSWSGFLFFDMVIKICVPVIFSKMSLTIQTKQRGMPSSSWSLEVE